MTTETPVAGLTTRPVTGTNPRPHGYTRYKVDGCRCYTCCFANSEHDKAMRRAIAYGTWQPYVNAQPMREHLLRLREAGMGMRRIAELSGVDRRRLQAVLVGRPHRGTGPQERVRPANAAAVLRVEVSLETIAPSAIVHSAGTQRRIQALVAIGWPQAHLANGISMLPKNLSRLLRSDQVMARTALAVRALYAELWNQDPRRHGVDNQAYSRARNAAAAAGWPPPAAWDDDEIDLPDATPAVVEAELNARELAAVRREEIQHLDSFGLGHEEIAVRLGLTAAYVRDVLRELRDSETEAAA